MHTDAVPMSNGGVWCPPPAAHLHLHHPPPPRTWLRAHRPRQYTRPTPAQNGGGGREWRCCRSGREARACTSSPPLQQVGSRGVQECAGVGGCVCVQRTREEGWEPLPPAAAHASPRARAPAATNQRPRATAPIRTALVGAPLALAVRAVPDGGRQGRVRASKREDQAAGAWCGVVQAGVVQAGVAQCATWCGAACGHVWSARRAMQAQRSTRTPSSWCSSPQQPPPSSPTLLPHPLLLTHVLAQTHKEGAERCALTYSRNQLRSTHMRTSTSTSTSTSSSSHSSSRQAGGRVGRRAWWQPTIGEGEALPSSPSGASSSSRPVARISRHPLSSTSAAAARVDTECGLPRSTAVDWRGWRWQGGWWRVVLPLGHA